MWLTNVKDEWFNNRFVVMIYNFNNLDANNNLFCGFFFFYR
jgi:hypothetical protein